MVDKIRAYSQIQFQESGFDPSDYEFNEQEGEFIGILQCKKYGKKRNVIAYVELEDGRKIMCTAFQTPNDYLGILDIDMSKKVKLTFNRSKTGNIRLSSVEEIK